MRKTLVDIAGKLNTLDEPWLLAGNTAAILQGAMIPAKKLTFYTTRNGSYTFGNYFADYRKEKVKYREKHPLAGHAGLFYINEIEIRIVGEPEIFFQHRKYPVPILDITMSVETTEIDGEQIPLLPLPWLLVLGLMAKDDSLVRAVYDCGIDKAQILDITNNLGVSYFLKDDIENLYSHK